MKENLSHCKLFIYFTIMLKVIGLSSYLKSTDIGFKLQKG